MSGFLGEGLGMGQRPIHTVVYRGKRVPVSEYLELERANVKVAFESFSSAFSILEYSLSALLHAILGSSIRDRIPYAIYYSVNSFDARVSIVENALTEAIRQNDKLKPLAAPTHWPYLAEKLRSVRILRNAVAHGALHTLLIRNKPHVRWLPPATDVIRVGRIIAKRQIPGLTAEDINRGKQLLGPVVECLDCLNLLLRASRRERTAWSERFARLDEHLQTVRSLYPGGQKKAGQKVRPESSEE